MLDVLYIGSSLNILSQKVQYFWEIQDLRFVF